jgi:hypothetical protein
MLTHLALTQTDHLIQWQACAIDLGRFVPCWQTKQENNSPERYDNLRAQIGVFRLLRRRLLLCHSRSHLQRIA